MRSDVRACVRVREKEEEKKKENPFPRDLSRAFLFSLFDQCHLVIWATCYRAREKTTDSSRSNLRGKTRVRLVSPSIDRPRGSFDSELLHPLSCERDLGRDCGERRKRQNGKSVRAKGSRRGQSGRKVNCIVRFPSQIQCSFRTNA